MPDLKKFLSVLGPDLIALRRDIHRHPELGYREERTASLVEGLLSELPGLSVARLTGTGVVGVLGGAGEGPTLLLRADLDALPLAEESGESFASETPGVMHACGHDGHTAILVFAAKALAALRDRWAGTVKFVFQPNEEEVGALAMIEAGVLEDPAVSAAAALHLWAPLPLGRISVAEGVSWAGMDHFRIRVTGVGGHTASPHLARDPILAAAHIVVGAQILQSRGLDPLLASSLVFGRVQGGQAANVIPESAELEGTLRYLFDGGGDGPGRPRARLRELAGDLARAYGTSAEVDFYCSQPPLSNDPAMAALGRQAAIETAGPGSLATFLNMGGEDFSEFSARVPSVMAMIGAGSPESGAVHPHHSPKFRLDERSLPLGLEWLVRLALAYLRAR
ncbi:MAG: amidohydrolase [Deltaproteobacteria bacterium]|jgi:amidohydrolase|nr:amidohydrolase [Deltaproteobacteria bacterium]